MSQPPIDEPESLPDPLRSRPPNIPVNTPARKELPRYRVILLEDRQTDMMVIVRTVMAVTRLCRTEATHKMWEAHHGGRSVLVTTYRERAELLAELLTQRGLKVTVEAA
jgi:ATP-dependent Clp protease adapter protein ClpS